MCCNLTSVSRHFAGRTDQYLESLQYDLPCVQPSSELHIAGMTVRRVTPVVVCHRVNVCLSVCLSLGKLTGTYILLTCAAVLFATTLTYLYSGDPVFKPRTGYPGFTSVPSCTFCNINFNMPRPFPCTNTSIRRTHAAFYLPALYNLCSWKCRQFKWSRYRYVLVQLYYRNNFIITL